MVVILPLGDNEEIKFLDKSKNLKIVHIRSSDCCHPYNHVFFSEIGKLIYFKNTFLKNIDDDEDIAFIQNRRYFENISTLSISNENEVITSPFETFCNLKSQFDSCHHKYSSIFENILNEYELNDILNERSFNPHNIFIAKKKFVEKYANFLEKMFLKYFDESFNDKGGAWMAERLLFAFLKKNNYNIKQMPFKEISK